MISAHMFILDDQNNVYDYAVRVDLNTLKQAAYDTVLSDKLMVGFNFIDRKTGEYMKYRIRIDSPVYTTSEHGETFTGMNAVLTFTHTGKKISSVWTLL